MSSSPASSLSPLLIVGLDEHCWSSALERRLRTLQPSGILLLLRCLQTPGQTAELLARIARTCDSPPFLAITEEGGNANPLKAFLSPLPAPLILARRGPAAVKRLGELVGSALALLGFNLNFAPRLDLASPNDKPGLDVQTFGSDADHVTRCAEAFITGLHGHRILPCGKHFPGRGTPEYDENGVPVVGKSMLELWREDLLPFRKLLPHLPLLKLSNVSYKAYDFDLPQPAARSAKVVYNLLRFKLRYRGLAVADLLELIEEVSRHMGPKGAFGMSYEVFAESIKAGCDLQIVKWGGGSTDAALSRLQRAVESGKLGQGRVADALRRIRTTKKGLRRPTGKLSARRFDALAREFEAFNQFVQAGDETDE
jgi:beta-N-acetylhexosaminidase